MKTKRPRSRCEPAGSSHQRPLSRYMVTPTHIVILRSTFGCVPSWHFRKSLSQFALYGLQFTRYFVTVQILTFSHKYTGGGMVTFKIFSEQLLCSKNCDKSIDELILSSRFITSQEFASSSFFQYSLVWIRIRTRVSSYDALAL